MSVKVKRKLRLGFCPVGNGDSIDPFNRVFAEKQDISKHGFTGVDAVIFWGGTDISPSYYKEPPHLRTQQTDVPSSRDIFEWKAMNYCKANNIPMIGICRGAQLMCVFAGGKLIQHVNGHHSPHIIQTSTNELFTATSDHHQMMYPFDVDHELLAFASRKMSSVYEDGWNSSIKDMIDKPEPEVVFFPKIQGLAIQGHPEWACVGRFADYCNELVLHLVEEKEELCA